MKPVFVSHEKYQNFVMEQLQAHYSGSGILVLRNDMWPTVTKLWITDLSEITKQLSDSYGKTGPPPRDPACMLRCYLLLILTNPTMSITQWVNELYKVPLYALCNTHCWIRDRKSTRLNSSHVAISYAVFCLEEQMM